MKFDRPLDDIIKQRSSWRTFQSKIISMQLKDELQDFFKYCITNSPFHSKMRFEILEFPNIAKEEKRKLGTYGMISGAQSFIVGAVEKSTNAWVDYGYVMEAIILKATELNLGTCWLGGTFSRSEFASRIHLQENESLPAITPIGFPRTRNLKGKAIRFLIQAKKRKKWADLFFQNNFDSHLQINMAKKFTDAFHWVQLAPSAGNKQPWRLLYEKDKKEIHFFLNRGNLTTNNLYWKLQSLDLGISMLHFNLGCEKKKIYGFWKKLETLNFKKIPKNFDYQISWLQKNS